MHAKRNLIIAAALVITLIFVIITIKDEPVASLATAATEGHSYEETLDAIMWVESRGDANAVCPDGCCVGAYQLTEIYVDDCNRILGLYGDETRVTYAGRWNKEMSRHITMIVTGYYAIHDWQDKYPTKMDILETMARTHKNPNKRNHPDTAPYWWKIRARLEAK